MSDPTEHPPCLREEWELITERCIACDHHFGDDGTSDHCTKCGTDRDTANQIGRAHRRRMTHMRSAAADESAE